MRLSVDIYKHRDRGCTNGGLSDQCDEAILIWDESYEEIIKNAPHYSRHAFVLVSGYGSREFKAVPLAEVIDVHDHTKPYNTYRSMFGGNFLYSSDSRFPADHPIHIHDRYE